LLHRAGRLLVKYRKQPFLYARRYQGSPSNGRRILRLCEISLRCCNQTNQLL